MLKKDLQRHSVYDTPYSIKALFLASDNFYSSDIVNLLTKDSRIKSNIIYDQDRLNLGFLSGLPEEDRESILEIIKLQWDRIRKVITETLQKQNIDVLELVQQKFGEQPDIFEATRTPWTPLKTDPKIMCKISGSKEPSEINGFIKFTELRHPHLSPETVYKVSDGYTVSLAPDLSQWQNILEANQELNLLDKLRHCLNAINATCYLHSQGIVHCDIKPENIIVRNDQTLLTDMESACLLERDFPEKLTDLYYEYSYYTKKSTDNLDEKRDVFSWGITLFVLLVNPNLLNELLSGKSRTYPVMTSEQVEDYLSQKIELHIGCFSIELALLIKTMLLANRSQRPSINLVANQLKGILNQLT